MTNSDSKKIFPLGGKLHDFEIYPQKRFHWIMNAKATKYIFRYQPTWNPDAI